MRYFTHNNQKLCTKPISGNNYLSRAPLADSQECNRHQLESALFIYCVIQNAVFTTGTFK